MPPPPPPPAAPGGAASSNDGAGMAARRPQEGGKGEWKIIDVSGGWLCWSKPTNRVDAHCQGHFGGDKCHMNRQIRHGSLGLCLAWLQRGQCGNMSRYDHELLKETLSSVDARGARLALREAFQQRAVDDEACADLVAYELELRGSQTEPPTLNCPPLHNTIARLLKDPNNLETG